MNRMASPNQEPQTPFPSLSGKSIREIPNPQRQPSEPQHTESYEDLLAQTSTLVHPDDHIQDRSIVDPETTAEQYPPTPAPSRSSMRRRTTQESRRWPGYPGPDPYSYRQHPSYRLPPSREIPRYSYDRYRDPAQEGEWENDYYDEGYVGYTPTPYPPHPRRHAHFTHRNAPTPTPTPSMAVKIPRTEETYVNRGEWSGYTQPDYSDPATATDYVETLKNAPPSAVLRLPWTMWMNSNAKNHFVATIGEFVGTFMFLFFAFAGTQVANVGSQGSNTDNTTTNDATGFSPIVLLYISLVFSFSLLVNVWVFFRVSGGLFNPAVTFVMLLTRSITITRGALLIVAQLAGSIFASYIVSVLFPTQFNVRTTLSPNTSLIRGVFIEAVLTAELVFTILMLAKEKHKATFIAPVGIGLSLFIGELVGVYYTGGSLNPARSFGPCVVTGTFDREHWIYWVGPGIGAILAYVFYGFIKILEYEVANPGQDMDEHDVKREKIADVESAIGAASTGSIPQVKEGVPGSPDPKSVKSA